MMNDSLTQSPGVVIGVIAGSTAGGIPVVTWKAGEETREAEALWMEKTPDWSSNRGLRVLLGFVDGDTFRPVILGFLDPRVGDAAPLQAEQDAQAVSVESGEGETRLPPDVLRIESERELVLECGKAKITLRADGRITVCGGYLVSRSRGVNKIQGASVQIN